MIHRGVLRGDDGMYNRKKETEEGNAKGGMIKIEDRERERERERLKERSREKSLKGHPGFRPSPRPPSHPSSFWG